MSSTTGSMQGRVRALLREAGPLTLDELLAALGPLPSKNPKQAVRNALTNDATCVSMGDGRYCYLPGFIAGAAMLVAMDGAARAQGLLAAGSELSALLWPAKLWGDRDRAPTLLLEGGPAIEVARGYGGWGLGPRFLLQLPTEFWQWWEARRGGTSGPGADALLVRCEDGEAGRYTVGALRTASLDAAAVVARNEEVREATVAVLKRSQGMRAEDLARRLLAAGLYHREPPPAPLNVALFEPPGPFFLERGQVTYRPEITPAMRRLFGPRIEAERWLEDGLLADVLGRPAPPEPEPAPPAPTPAPPRAATRGYRLKVSLDWDRRVWRMIEILDNQDLVDLHYAIQRAFGWDDDHLYAFFLSGRAWDSLTEIHCPFPGADAEPPLADEVTLAELELQPGQRFLYLFDFGDNLRHQIEVVDSFPAPAEGSFPRIVQSHGEAPPQYPTWDEDGEDGEEDW